MKTYYINDNNALEVDRICKDIKADIYTNRDEVFNSLVNNFKEVNDLIDYRDGLQDVYMKYVTDNTEVAYMCYELAIMLDYINYINTLNDTKQDDQYTLVNKVLNGQYIDSFEVFKEIKLHAKTLNEIIAYGNAMYEVYDEIKCVGSRRPGEYAEETLAIADILYVTLLLIHKWFVDNVQDGI